MTEKRIEDIVREEKAHSRAAPREKKMLRRMAQLCGVLLLVLAMVAAAVWWDMGSERTLKKMLNYDKTPVEEQVWRYVSAGGNRYALLGESTLLVASPSRVALLDDDGSELYGASVDLGAPCITVSGSLAAVYDAGGTTLYLFNESGFLRDMSAEVTGTLYAVSLNARGDLAVTAGRSGYRSCVTVYDAAGKKLYEINSSNRYMTDAVVSADGKRLAVSVPGEADGAFQSTVLLYSLSGESSDGAWSMSDSVVLQLCAPEGGFAAVADDRFTMVSDTGALLGAYSFEYPYLRDYNLGGDGFFALYLSRYRSGSAGKLVTLDENGALCASLDTHGEVLDISACGDYLCVLYADSLALYNANLEEIGRAEDTVYARAALQRADGSVVLLGSTEARAVVLE